MTILHFIVAPWRLLLLLSAFIILVDSVNLKEKLKPNGKLGVTLDYSFAISWPERIPANAPIKRNLLFSSHLKFSDLVLTITDGQLFKITLDAYDEMVVEANRYSVGKRQIPGTMTALAFDKEIILVSSQKGQSFTYESSHPSPVLETLQLCEATCKEDRGIADDESKPHRNNGQCGEPMAAHLYYHSRDIEVPLSEQRARVVTVGPRVDKQDGLFKVGYIGPCGEEEGGRGVSMNQYPR